MQLISDTSIWVDFLVVDGLELPFRLGYCFYLSTDAIEDELLSPPGLSRKLMDYGLNPLAASVEEYLAIEDIMLSFPKLSRYDALSLAIAVKRSLPLLTGDKALRKAGQAMSIDVKGTLWLFDELKRLQCIYADEYHQFMLALNKNNGKLIRLPFSEIRKRL
jgi:predicted nucleic acid-binding protein